MPKQKDENEKWNSYEHWSNWKQQTKVVNGRGCRREDNLATWECKPSINTERMKSAMTISTAHLGLTWLRANSTLLYIAITCCWKGLTSGITISTVDQLLFTWWEKLKTNVDLSQLQVIVKKFKGIVGHFGKGALILVRWVSGYS